MQMSVQVDTVEARMKVGTKMKVGTPQNIDNDLLLYF